jgi:HPt (histidine-containing phosphotransfer) domain-containing protein
VLNLYFGIWDKIQSIKIAGKAIGIFLILSGLYYDLLSILPKGIVMVWGMLGVLVFVLLVAALLFREELTHLFKERESKRPTPPRHEEQPRSTSTRERTAPPSQRTQAPQEKKTVQPRPTATRPKTTATPPRETAPTPPAAKPTQTRKKTPQAPVETPKVEKKQETPTPPQAKPAKTTIESYPDFDNSRLLDMGLSQGDADAFVQELVEQIDEFIPKIEAAFQEGDYHQVERLSHSIKGSATNLGTGGVADQLIAFNTYCKTGKDKETIENYITGLKHYQAKLKAQYS